MPRFPDHFVKSAIRLVRQSTTVPNTSNTSAFTAEISDMLTPFVLFVSSFRHSGRATGPRKARPDDRLRASPEIHNHDREYGFRACANRHIPRCAIAHRG